jgi:chromosome segregation ATPase
MEFHDYAAQETSALLSRLIASRSEASARQLQALRETLDAAKEALTEPPQVDHDLREVVGRLTHAAAEEVRRVRDDAQVSLAAVRSELDAERAAHRSVATSLIEAEQSISALRSEVDAERERAAAADRDLTVTLEAHSELESACRAAEAACQHETQLKAALEEDLKEAREQLDLALGEAAQHRARIEHLTPELARLEGELQEARALHAETEAARQTFESAQRQEADARIAAEADLQATRTLFDAEVANAARLAVELEAQASECVALRVDLANALQDGAERDALRAQRDSMAVERDAVIAQLGASNGRVQALESSQARHEATIRQLEAALQHDRQGDSRSRDQLVIAQQESATLRAEAEALRSDVTRVVSLLDASVYIVDELAKATTVPELLAALVNGLSLEFPRVALFRVKGNCVEGEMQVGFEQTTDVTKFVFPLTLDSLLTRVVGSRTLERLTGAALTADGATPFGGSPAAALALPIVLQGETLAVVYAEHSNPGLETDNASAGFAKLLVGEAAVLLMRHTHELKTMNELREYAAMLLREAEQMYTADAETGKAADDLRTRLKGNLDCARQLYSHRATLEGPAAAVLLDEQIAVAVQSQTPFAQDLATVVGRPKEKKPRRQAEAS